MSEIGKSSDDILAERLEEMHLQAVSYFQSVDKLRQECTVRAPLSEGDGYYLNSREFDPRKIILRDHTLGGKIFDQIASRQRGGLSFKDVMKEELALPQLGLVGEYFSQAQAAAELDRKRAAEAARNDLGQVMKNWRTGGLVSSTIRAGALASGHLSHLADQLSVGRSGKFSSYAVPAAIGAAVAGPAGALGVVAVIGLAKMSGYENKVGELCSQTAAFALSATAKVAEVSFIAIENTIDFASRLAKRRSQGNSIELPKLGNDASKPKL